MRNLNDDERDHLREQREDMRGPKYMDEQAVVDLLESLFAELENVDLPDQVPVPAETRTFEDNGVLTKNKGLVVSFADGSEFQITVVQSRRAPDQDQDEDDDDED